MGRALVLISIVALVTALTAVASPGSASAHERRTIGKYQLVVGFSAEPAYVNQPNGLDLRVSIPNEGPAGEPVTGLEQTLKAEVIVGGGANKMSLPLTARFNTPGAYDGRFIPTLVSDYTFHIFGTINGDAIDETFSSGPRTFNPVQDVADLQFPNKVPSNELLASQIASANSSSDSSDAALIAGIVGIVAGVTGMVLGGLALANSRRA